jgi:polyketide cyclase/dehydrase/lipid transport protein
MRTWTTTTTVDADPVAVLDVLTDPEACRRWAPVDFDVSGFQDDRLLTGSRARVTGRLAGRSVGFDVHVHEAADGRLTLSADGPMALDVRYDLAPAAGGSEVRATVGIAPGRGLFGRILAEATSALLSAGALDAAVSRLAREAVLAC